MNIKELLYKLSVAQDALEVYASKDNWYDRTHNNRIEFHDGSYQNMGYDTAQEALDEINKERK